MNKEQITNKQIIYSLKVVNELIKRGFTPSLTMPNPIKPQFNCWVFDVTPEFQSAVDDVLGKRGRQYG